MKVAPRQLCLTWALVFFTTVARGGVIHSRVWGGQGLQQATAVTRDSAGNTYVVGWTDTFDFPIRMPLLPRGGGVDGFLIKLDPSWNVVFSTWLGGDGDDQPNAVAVDAGGNIYVAGSTTSSTFAGGFPLANRASRLDGFVVKLSSAGSLQYAIALGGTADEAINGLSVAPNGHVLVGGYTRSSDLPVKNAFQPSLHGLQNGWIAELDGNGAIVWCSYFGGAGQDVVNATGVDSAGYIWIAGSTTSPNLPVLGAAQPALAGSQNAFVAEFVPGGSGLVFSTWLGGSGAGVGTQEAEAAHAIALDSQRNAYVAGATQSSDFPLRNPWQATYGGGSADAFLTGFDAAGNIRFSTFLGGDALDCATAVGIVNGLVVVAGYTLSNDFPLATNPGSWHIGANGFLTEFDPGGSAAWLSSYVDLQQWDAVLAMTASDPVVLGGLTSASNPSQITMASASDVALVYPTTLNVTVLPSGTGTATVSPQPILGKYLAGTQVCVSPVPSVGWKVQSWSGTAVDSSGCLTIATTASVTITMTPVTYRLTVAGSPAGAGTVTSNPAASNGVYNTGTRVCLTAVPAAGWQFSSWSGAVLDSGNCLTLTGDIIITAAFTRIMYALASTSSPAAGGTVAFTPASTNGTYASGTRVCLTPNPASGWQFTSWSGATVDAANCLTVNANTTVTANFSRIQYTLTMVSSPANSGTVTATPASSSGTYTAATRVCLTPVPATGWQFVSWSGAALDAANCLTVNANTTVTATFSRVMFTLTLTASPTAAGTASAAPSSADGTYASGTPVCLSATPAAGWQFVSWSGAAVDGANCITMNANTTVTATFAHVVYTLTMMSSPANSGSITATPSSSNGAYASGTRVCLAPAAASGWQFASWSGAVLDGANCLTLNANSTVTATFSRIMFKLTLSSSPTAGGTVSANPAYSDGTYPSGTRVCLNAVAASGWAFSGWSGVVDSYGCLVVAGDTSIRAWFFSQNANCAPDLNQDAHPDLIWQNDATHQIVSWNMGGVQGTVVQAWNWIAAGDQRPWTVVAVADLDRDGHPDLIWQNDQTRQVVVWFMTGPDGNLIRGWEWISAASQTGWRVAAVADLNRDGHPDLVWQSDASRQVVVWYMGGGNGTAAQDWQWIDSAGEPGWRVVAAADLNNDGHPDLIWQFETTGQALVWYLGGPQGNVALNWAWINSGGAPGWTLIAAADLDRDGSPDLIWECDKTRQVMVWYMGGPMGNVAQSWSWLDSHGEPGWTVVN